MLTVTPWLVLLVDVVVLSTEDAGAEFCAEASTWSNDIVPTGSPCESKPCCICVYACRWASIHGTACLFAEVAIGGAVVEGPPDVGPPEEVVPVPPPPVRGSLPGAMPSR